MIIFVAVELTQVAAQQKSQKRKSEPININEWLAKRVKGVKSKAHSSTCNELPEPKIPLLPKYELPSFLQNIGNLPPSVLPPPQDCLQGLNINGWG